MELLAASEGKICWCLVGDMWHLSLKHNLTVLGVSSMQRKPFKQQSLYLPVWILCFEASGGKLSDFKWKGIIVLLFVAWGHSKKCFTAADSYHELLVAGEVAGYCWLARVVSWPFKPKFSTIRCFLAKVVFSCVHKKNSDGKAASDFSTLLWQAALSADVFCGWWEFFLWLNGLYHLHNCLWLSDTP